MIVIAVLLLFGSAGPSTETELSGPDFLDGMHIDQSIPCNDFSCLVVTKDDKKYLAVVNSKNETQSVYEIVGTRKKPILNLVWAPEREWI